MTKINNVFENNKTTRKKKKFPIFVGNFYLRRFKIGIVGRIVPIESGYSFENEKILRFVQIELFVFGWPENILDK